MLKQGWLSCGFLLFFLKILFWIDLHQSHQQRKYTLIIKWALKQLPPPLPTHKHPSLHLIRGMNILQLNTLVCLCSIVHSKVLLCVTELFPSISFNSEDTRNQIQDYDQLNRNLTLNKPKWPNLFLAQADKLPWNCLMQPFLYNKKTIVFIFWVCF